MISVTCVVHHGEVEKSQTVKLPDGPVCHSCYVWLEELLANEEDADDGPSEWDFLDEEEEEDDDDYID